MTQNIDLSVILSKLGFTNNESKVYLTLIKIGNSHAGKIAQEARLDRSSTYNALNSLIETGIVSTIYENKRTTYVPANPVKILDVIREKEELAKKVIPLLQQRYMLETEKKNVTVFQGYRGLKTVFEDILKSCKANDEYLVIGSEGQFTESMPYYSPIFRKRKENAKIKTKILVRSGLPLKPRGNNTQTRKLPFNTVSPATVNIYGSKVAIIMWGEKPESIVIDNKNVAESFKNYFVFMWKYAK